MSDTRLLFSTILSTMFLIPSVNAQTPPLTPPPSPPQTAVTTPDQTQNAKKEALLEKRHKIMEQNEANNPNKAEPDFLDPKKYPDAAKKSRSNDISITPAHAPQSSHPAAGSTDPDGSSH